MSGLRHSLWPWLEPAQDGEWTPGEVIAHYMDHYSGGHFERYGKNERCEITADDLVACGLLSIAICGRGTGDISTGAVLAIEREKASITKGLGQLPTDIDLHNLNTTRFELLMGDGSAGSELYWLLRSEAIGLGPVATFKLLARKRPRLMPVRDSVLTSALHRADPWWRPWWETLVEDLGLVQRLKQIRDDATADLSVLRTADVLVWMRQRGADQTGVRRQVGSPL